MRIARSFVARTLALALSLAGCAELGVVGDGTSVSVGKASRGYLIDGARLPDHGVGFTSAPIWLERGNRYGTDELIALVRGVAKRLHGATKTRIVVADLSGQGGGGGGEFHRSHQSGRDADIVYPIRDADGTPIEPDAMRAFDERGLARDKSGIALDVPRTWKIVKELITAPEATVQFIFMYEPIALRVLDYAAKIGEPAPMLERARKTLHQPGDSARHDDHMHVRIYCAAEDRQYGCVDIGPMELLAEREAERAQQPASVQARVAPLRSEPRSEPSTDPRPAPPVVDTPLASFAPVIEVSPTGTGTGLGPAGPDRADRSGGR